MESIVSSHDLAHDPEAFYHGLMIGLTASLYKDPNYEIHSNRESGYRRYDYLILSRDLNKPTLLLEFKRVNKTKDTEQLTTQLEKAAQDTLLQISQQISTTFTTTSPIGAQPSCHSNHQRRT